MPAEEVYVGGTLASAVGSGGGGGGGWVGDGGGGRYRIHLNRTRSQSCSPCRSLCRSWSQSRRWLGDVPLPELS